MSGASQINLWKEESCKNKHLVAVILLTSIKNIKKQQLQKQHPR